MARVRGGRTRRDPFVRIERTVIEDPDLSAVAKVVLAWLLDKTTFPGGWETDVARIAEIMHEGVYAIRTALDDLDRIHYLHRVEGTKHGGRGKKAEWWVTDDPSKPWIESEVLELIPAANRAEIAANRDPAPISIQTEVIQPKAGARARSASKSSAAAKRSEPRTIGDSRALLLATEVWEAADPKPALGFPQVRSVARKLVAVRPESIHELVKAMLAARTMTVASVELVLNTKKRDGNDFEAAAAAYMKEQRQ